MEEQQGVGTGGQVKGVVSLPGVGSSYQPNNSVCMQQTWASLLISCPIQNTTPAGL